MSRIALVALPTRLPSELRPLHRGGDRVDAAREAAAGPGRGEEVRDGRALGRALTRDHRHAHAARAHALHAVRQWLHGGRERPRQHGRAARRPRLLLGAHAVLHGQERGAGPACGRLQGALEVEGLDRQQDEPGVARVGRVHHPAHRHDPRPVRLLDAQARRVVAPEDPPVEQDHLVAGRREGAAQERAHGAGSHDQHPGQGGALRGAHRGVPGRVGTGSADTSLLLAGTITAGW